MDYIRDLSTGKQIKAARSLTGMTQQQLADLAGLHRNSIVNAEATGMFDPFHSWAADRIEDAFNSLGVTFSSAGGLKVAKAQNG